MGGGSQRDGAHRGSRGLDGLLEEGHHGAGAALVTEVEASMCIIWTLLWSPERGWLPAAWGRSLPLAGQSQRDRPGVRMLL